MLPFRVFSTVIHKKLKSNHYLLLLAIFPDLEMTKFWSVSYICQLCKLNLLFWTYPEFWAMILLIVPFL